MSNEESSLYDRMGGEEGISDMVDDFYGRVFSNPELQPFFKDVPVDRLQRMQREFFGAATGGPVVFSGKPLSHVHYNLGITRRHFQQFTEHLIETLEEKGIDQKEILDLVSKVNVYADEIIGETGVEG